MEESHEPHRSNGKAMQVTAINCREPASAAIQQELAMSEADPSRSRISRSLKDLVDGC